MNNELKEQIESIIRDGSDMTIATVREDGFPQATTVSYMSDGLTIYFITLADSAKAQNIARDNRVSLAIDRPYNNWNEIESLSLAAAAQFVSDSEERAKIGELLLQKFPQAADMEPEDTGDLSFIRLDPKVVSVIDYRKGFGHTELVEIEAL